MIFLRFIFSEFNINEIILLEYQNLIYKLIKKFDKL